MSSEKDDGGRKQRVNDLLEKLHQETLSIPEADELLAYLEEDLARARAEGPRDRFRRIRRYKWGVESYIALRTGRRVLGK